MNIYEIIGLVCFASFLSTVITLGQEGELLQPLRAKLGIDVKPFNCIVCLPIWFGIATWAIVTIATNAPLVNLWIIFAVPALALIYWRLIP